MMRLVITLLLTSVLIAFYVGVSTDKREVVECACMVLIAVVLMALLILFVFYGPTPDYLPPYGSDPCDMPYQMKD